MNTEQEIKEKLQNQLKPSRFIHTLGVVESAEGLWKKYISQDEKEIHHVRLAALLHDCAKNISTERLLEIAGENDLDLDEICLKTPELLHGPVGAIVAKNDYFISNDDILNAIRYHTTGRPGMSNLEKIIYLADYIEPGRKYPGVENLRQIAEKDLEQGLLTALSNTIVFVTQNGGLIHPNTVLTRNEYLLQKQG